jgi:hypothetical protein
LFQANNVDLNVCDRRTAGAERSPQLQQAAQAKVRFRALSSSVERIWMGFRTLSVIYCARKCHALNGTGYYE